MMGQQSLILTHIWKENGFKYPVLFDTSVSYPFKYYVIKCGGREGEPKYDFVWYGGREGLEKGQIVLHNTWTAPKQSWNTHETAMEHCWNTTPPMGF